MVTAEAAYPYDRIKLSKALNSSAEELALRSRNFYADYDIEVMTSTEVVNRQVPTDSKGFSSKIV
jgi:NAD(P)H-nitrite reductase large subunit